MSIDNKESWREKWDRFWGIVGGLALIGLIGFALCWKFYVSPLRKQIQTQKETQKQLEEIKQKQEEILKK